MMLMIMDITIGMVILMITALILVWLFCPQQLMTIVLMITTKNNDKTTMMIVLMTTSDHDIYSAE